MRKHTRVSIQYSRLLDKQAFQHTEWTMLKDQDQYTEARPHTFESIRKRCPCSVLPTSVHRQTSGSIDIVLDLPFTTAVNILECDDSSTKPAKEVVVSATTDAVAPFPGKLGYTGMAPYVMAIVALV